MVSEKELQRALSLEGHKLTRPRLAVLKVIAATNASLTPGEIHTLAQAFYPNTGLVTVYRTLDLLAARGLVRRVHGPDGRHAYAPASAAHGHHLICENCHTVTEFENCNLEGLVSSLQRRTGFTISGHRLELFGYCPNCRV